MNIRETEKFQRGRNGEQIVASVLKKRGWMIIPSYDYSGEDDHAPRMEGAHVSYIIPDLDISRHGKRLWAEVKTKKSPSLGRISGKPEHGIPLRHFQHYQKVERESGCPVWIFIFEETTGEILCQWIDKLGSGRISNARYMSKGGMVYWLREQFPLFSKV